MCLRSLRIVFITSLRAANRRETAGDPSPVCYWFFVVARLDFSYTMTRDKFDKLNKKLFERCLETVRRVLKDGK